MAKHPPKKFRKIKRTRSIHDKAGNGTSKAILDTLRYRQLFNYPMTYHQLWNYLIVDQYKSRLSTMSSISPTNDVVNDQINNSCNTDFSVDQFIKALEILVKSGKVIFQNGQYSMEKVNYAVVEKRKARAKELLIKANLATKYLKQIPWIEMLAVTGSVSAFNANDGDDIDMLVVTKPNRLWLSRLFLVSALKLLGIYWNAKNPAGTVCPNILLTSNNLSWDEKNRNLYVANEISLLYPLYFKNNCYFDFLRANDWVGHYLPNFNKICQHDHEDQRVGTLGTDISNRHTLKKQLKLTLGTSNKKSQNLPRSVSNVVDLLEFLARKSQLYYMRKKRTTETITNNLIHFNIHDSAPTILRKFRNSESLLSN